MIYHARPEWLPGGYAGVDVFFVISGYLITRILLAESQSGTLSLLRFWDRRARRILPALFFMMIVVGCFGFALLTPIELKGLSASVGASVISAANLYFWRASGGYFALAAPLQPLLHLWSLGVEEQFYLCYPLILLAFVRWQSTRLVSLLISLIAVSLVLAIYMSHYHPVAAFFLPFSRAWELAGGCIAAAVGLKRVHLSQWLNQVLSGASLAVILATLIFVDDSTPWPGLPTVPLIVASCWLVAASGEQSWVNTFLKSPPLVSLGVVSYGAYLWHHPLISLTRMVWPGPLLAGAMLALLALSVALACVSYVLIERPFRDRRRIPAKIFWPIIIGSGLGLSGGAFALWESGGAPQRLPAAIQRAASMTETYPKQMDACFFAPGTAKSLDEACLRGRVGPVSTAVVGDSHAMALAPGLDPLLAASQTRAQLLIAAGCPFVDDQDALSEMQAHCPAFTRRVLGYLRERSSIRVVVIAARWPYQFERSFYDNGEGGVELGPDDGLEPDRQRDQRFERSLLLVIKQLSSAGKLVVLVHSVPEPGWDVPKYFVHAHLLGRNITALSIDEIRWWRRASAAESMLERISARVPGVVDIRPRQTLCAHGRCFLGTAASPYYFDDDHPSSRGARVMIAGDLQRRHLDDAVIRAMANRIVQ